MAEYYCCECKVQLAAWERDEYGNKCQNCAEHGWEDNPYGR